MKMLETSAFFTPCRSRCIRARINTGRIRNTQRGKMKRRINYYPRSTRTQLARIVYALFRLYSSFFSLHSSFLTGVIIVASILYEHPRWIVSKNCDRRINLVLFFFLRWHRNGAAYYVQKCPVCCSLSSARQVRIVFKSQLRKHACKTLFQADMALQTSTEIFFIWSSNWALAVIDEKVRLEDILSKF